ncbi:putative membrane protein [Asticcacaulis biprosthecium C19]|uniref:Putative membrane protein n=1 Tax=Asticcacaulis biprosthecium C19 TaxID=715226 RepID=F4QJ32_9CAUL|nr:hypothetical protein [Asticcacaulis biprosthecium]EGF91863.1 putative membrane protein [Asticcacaulis biprosthecium C19]
MDIGPTFAAFCVCTLLFVWAQVEKPRLGSWIRSAALFGLIAALFFIGFASPNRESLSVHLTQMAADPKTPAPDALIVGDHHDYADFIVKPYAAEMGYKPATGDHRNFVTVSTATRTVSLTTAPGDPQTGRAAMVVAWRDGDGLRFDRAIALGTSARICLDKACANPFVFDAATWRKTLSATPVTGRTPHYYQRVFRPAAFGARQSAILHTPDGRWHLLVLDPDVRVDGAALAKSQVPLTPIQPVRVSLFRLDLPDPELGGPVRLVSRQTLAIADTGQAVVLRPRTPLVARAGSCANPRMTLTRVSADNPVVDYGTPEKALLFAALGNGSLGADGSYRAASPMNRADDGPLLGGATSLCDFHGRDFSVTGQKLSVVKSLYPDDAALSFSVQGMRIPWLLLAFAAFGILAADRIGARGWQNDRPEYVLVGLMQYLLTLRLLIGVRGSLMDPNIVPSDVYSDVAAAFVALPLALIALRPLAEFGTKSRLILAAGMTAVFALIWLWTGSLDRPFITVIVITAIALGWPAALHVLRTVQPRLPQITLPARMTQLAARYDLPVLAIALIAGAAVARLIAFWVFGIRERAVIAVSLPYLALILPGFGLYLAHVGRAVVKTLPQAVVFGVLVLIAVIVVPFITRDHGFAIIQTFPILAVAFAVAWSWPAGGHRWPWFAALPAAAAGFAALLWLFPYIHGAPPTGNLLETLRYALKFQDSNDIRLLHQFHGDLVASFPTRVATANSQFWRDIGTFTASLTGTGFLTDQGLGVFGYQSLHFSDNLSAVHIMHPFGRIGAVLFLGAVLVSVHHATRPSGQTAAGRLTARLALWTIAFSAIYMVLANLGWVPFTGRNIYLLAVSSGSDLAEGFALLTMALIGLRLVRPS